MNLGGILITALSLAGPLVAPVPAQLVHVTLDAPDGFVLFKATEPNIPLDQAGGFVTQLDLTYDSQAMIGALDPAKNFWHMHVEVPAIDRAFDVVRPFHTVSAWERGLMFEYLVSKPGVYESMQINLVFDTPISTEGLLPPAPLPALGTTEFNHSYFYFQSGSSTFDIPKLAEVYGVSDIVSLTSTMTPVPEPSDFALTGLLMLGVAIGVRKLRFVHAPARCG